MKKLFLSTLFLCLVSVAAVAQSFTVDGINYSVSDASNHFVTVTGYDENYTEDIHLEGEVTYDGETYYVRVIGDYAFYKSLEICKNLKSVGNLPYCTSIGAGSFYYCSSLISVGDLSNCTSIGYSAFDNCSSLTSVGNLSNCTSIGDYAFRDCSNLTSVGYLSNCTSIGDYAFRDCSNLTSVGNLSNCTSIGDNAFCGCISLTSIGDLSNCTSIGDYAFYSCSSFSSVGNLSNCTSIGSYAFSGCSSLTSVDLSNCASIGSSAFSGCSSLSSVGELSNCTSIGGSAFRGCSHLFRIELPSNKVVSISGSPINEWQIVAVPSALLADYRSADNWKDIALQILSLDTQTDYDITTTADPTTSGVQQQIGEANLRNVINLKVSGSFNGYDLMIFRNKMPNLHILDLSKANVVGCDYQYYENYAQKEDNVLGDYAFNNLPKLIEVKLPETLTGLGRYAFKDCYALRSVNIPEGVTAIPEGCFYYTNITDAIIPEGVTAIESGAFWECYNLERVAFPSTLQTIGSYAFHEDSRLLSFSLPPSVNSIGRCAFRYCSNLTELHIPASITSIGENAFYSCSALNDIYTYTIEPVAIGQNTFSTWTTATIHTPTQSHDNYYWDTQWSQFLAQVDFDEPYQYFYINNDFKPEAPFSGEPNTDFNEGSGFIVDGNDQELGDIHHHHNGDGQGASIIDNNDLTAKNLIFDISVKGGRWYFFSFPFNVKLTDITAPGSYVFRHYDGLVRALLGSGGWKELGDDETELIAGRGYIFQCSASGTLTLRVPQPDFKGGKKTPTWQHNLAENKSERGANDAGWNFIGNPYLSYYDLDRTGYDAPVTRWNGSAYEAIRPGDDDYYFHPFEAFFVQSGGNGSHFDFERQHRETYQQSQRSMERKHIARRARKIDATRQLVNLTLTASDGTTDKTRVVFNDRQEMGYEASCDAAKFLATGVPQLFSLEPTGESVKYAINERPVADGLVRLGYCAPAAAQLTMAALRRDADVVLRDLATGATWDFSEGDYSFFTEAGTFCDRFVLVRKADTTGIGEAPAADAEATPAAYNAAGQRVKADAAQGVVIYENGRKVVKK